MTSTCSSSSPRPQRRGSSTSTLAALKQSQERITSRIIELQSILSHPNTTIVKRQSAKVELAQLQKQVKHHNKRASVDALRRTSQEGVVTKNRAIINKNIQLRIQHEEEIKLLQLQLQSFGIAAVERRMLEEELKKVQCELTKLNNEEELEERVNNSYSVAYDSIGYGSMENGEEEESLYEEEEEEYVPPVSIKVNHGQSKRISALETEVEEPSGDAAAIGIEEMLLAKEEEEEEDEAELMRRISLEGIGKDGRGDEKALTKSGLMDQWHQTYGANSMAELLDVEENDDDNDNGKDIARGDERGGLVDQWDTEANDDEIVLVVPTKTNDGADSTNSSSQPYRRRVTKENLQKRNLSIEMVEDQIRQYSNERMKELEGLNEDEFLNVLMARQANVAGLIGISDDELSIGHDINDLGGDLKGDDTLLTDDSTDSTQGDDKNNVCLESELTRLQSLSADPDDYIPGGSGSSDYQFEEQLRLAQEAIDAIEALDKERAQERHNLDVMMEEHELNSGKRMQSLEVHVAKLEMAMLQHEDGQEEMAMKLTQVLGDKIKALDQHIVNLVGDPSDEDKSILYWKNKAARLEAKCFALEGDLEECDMTIQDLKEWKRIQEERIASIQKEKASASNSKPPRRPTIQEEKQELKRKLTVEDMQTAKLKAELDVLKAMKAQFDESDKDEQLRMLTQEIMKLISDKEDALDQAEKVKKVYEKSLSSKGPMDKSRRRLSSCAAMDPSFSAQLRRASMSGDINQQMKETAKIEMMALEERLKMIDGEKGELMKELETMKALLAAADGEKPGKKTERLVYQLSCRKCNKHMNFVGTTHTDLRTTMERHFAEVVKATKSKRKSMKSTGSVTTTDSSTKGKHEQWSEEFALHFANHVSRRSMFKTIAEKDVIAYCRENVKVEVLRRSDGAELYWEDTE